MRFFRDRTYVYKKEENPLQLVLVAFRCYVEIFQQIKTNINEWMNENLYHVQHCSINS